ncbi:MAG TPA: AsmA family protein [Terriglobia bacterium]|nr:AsmA family protein [Terriglobia bacterium]
MRTRRYARIAALALALLAAAWFLPSILSAERYRHRVATRLQQALGRPVQFGHISLKFIPRPGFSIDNVSVLEDPQFGAEPFARVDHIDCDVSLVGLLRGQAALESLSLEGAAINLVRDSPGRWNVERFVAGAAHALPGPSSLSIEVSDARLNFKFGVDKKPFAVTDLHGRVDLDRKRRLLNFDLTGSPVRTDIRTGLGMPSPGQIELQGLWKPGQGGENALNATLRTRGALLYDWIPLLAGRNPEIYGLIDAELHLTGSPSLLNVEAQLRLNQLRRWESPPPVADLPVSISLKGQLDRLAGRADIGDLEASFGDSRLSLKGSMLQLGANPLLNLTAATDRSRLENFTTLVGRLAGQPPWWDPKLPLRLTGILDSAVSIQGEWPHLSYSGSASSRSSRLVVGNSAMPVSDTVVRFEGRHFALLPVRISATPNLTVVAEGSLNLPALTPSELTPGRVRQAAHKRLRPEGLLEPGYRLSFSARPSAAHEILTLAAGLGFGPARSIDARGLVTANVTLAGTLRPFVHPSLTGAAEVRATELVLPGLIKPIQISKAHVEIDNGRITIDPLTASFAGAVFTGRVEHAGARTEPWTFEARSPALDLAEASSWFEALGHPTATPWFELIPGLSTLAARRAAGTSLFNALNVRGELSTSALTYKRVTLRNVRAHVEMSKRLLRVTSAEFRVSAGRGLASAEADLNGPQPRLATDFAVSGLRIENWASHLPSQLAEARGAVAFSGRLSAEGASFPALETTLQGHARLTVTNVDLGHYDPLRDTIRAAAWGEPPPVRNSLTLHSGEISLDVRDRHLIVKPTRFELGGAVFEITGSCGFDGKAQFVSSADLQNASRRWTDESDPNVTKTARFLLSGALDALKATSAGPTAPPHP